MNVDKELNLLWDEVALLKDRIAQTWDLTYSQYGTWDDWTPVVTQGGAVTTVALSARYAKIGSTIILRARIYVSTAGTAGQPITISGIPTTMQPSDVPTVIGTAMVLDVGSKWHQGALYAEGANSLKIQTDRQPYALGVTPSIGLALYDQIWINGAYER